MAKNKSTILLHYDGYWSKATRAPQTRYIKGKQVKLTVDPSSITFLDIIIQVSQIEGSNHALKISYKSPSSGSNAYVKLEDDAGLVKMFNECRGEPCIELYSVLERPDLEGSLPGDACLGPLTWPSHVRKRKRKFGSGKNKKAEKCKGLECHTVAVLNSPMQTLQAGNEILEKGACQVLERPGLEGGLPGDACMGPLTWPSHVRKRKRKKQVKKAEKCEGLESHTVAVLNSPMRTLQAGSEILEKGACQVLERPGLEGGLPGDACMGPLIGPSDVRKRKRKSGSGKMQVKKAEKCKGLESHKVAVLNSHMQTLQADYEILESEDLWNLLEKLEATLQRLRLRREKEKTSSPIEIEDDDCEEDLIDSLVSGQNDITSEKSASDSSVEHGTKAIIPSKSNHKPEQTQSGTPPDAISSTFLDAPMSNSDSSVNNEALMELFPNLVIPDNVPAKDKSALELQLSMLKAASKAMAMFLRCPFDENTQIGMDSLLKIIEGGLRPEFDEYFGTKPRELTQGVSNFVSRIQTLRAQDCIAEAELVLQKNIEKCKDAVKYAEENWQLSLNAAIKVSEKSRRSKEEFRDALVDVCNVAERLDSVSRDCMSKNERRRCYLRDYFKKVLTVQESQSDLASAEKSRETEVSCISEKILEERKQKLLKEAEVLLASIMS